MKDETAINTTEELDEIQSRPPAELVRAMSGIRGDLLVLGAGGKMGPSLTRMAARAFEAAGLSRRVFAVSRFGERDVSESLNRAGVATIACDLLEQGALETLPEVDNVIYMAGRKFGSTGDEPLTWAVNAFLAGEVMRRYRKSRIVLFSTGNVYPFTTPDGEGCDEEREPAPVGEYAWSCLARERIAEYYSKLQRTPVSILRINYAIDLRYGVLTDIALRILRGEPVDIRVGFVNVIWQADACTAALLALGRCSSPPFVLNVTGAETLSVRALAENFGRAFGTTVSFRGEEADASLLSDAGRFHDLWHYPKTGIDAMVGRIAHWLRIGGPIWNKPTHFEEREGKF